MKKTGTFLAAVGFGGVKWGMGNHLELGRKLSDQPRMGAAHYPGRHCH